MKVFSDSSEGACDTATGDTCFERQAQQDQGDFGRSCLWVAPPSAYCAFCARHVAANFALKFKSVAAKKLLMNAAYAKSELDFDYWHGLLEDEDKRMGVWTSKMEKEL
ncbi:hypothetical protein PIB30_045746 [Stylosanthes scabra]|uniref:Uncharacterized protein n=1 Tax=Stylosanthes scabra TaxID=79078 RepID=A0ABU6QGV9_9FABA|nr:hypothetical protein [Stylosanthes scabra]